MTSVDDATTTRLRELGTATLYEASKLDCDLDPLIRPAWPGATIVGPALPVRTGSGDNLALHRALEHVVPGDVLVADGGGVRCGSFGEVLGVAAQQRGAAGLVIDGGVRDVVQLEQLGFPVFSRWIAVRRTSKADPGRIGEPVDVAGRRIHRGDVVVADADGVIVLPQADVPAILAAGEQRVAAEERYLTSIRAGASTLDLYGFGS